MQPKRRTIPLAVLLLVLLSTTALCATGSIQAVDSSDSSTQRARPPAASTRPASASRPAAGSSTANRASGSSTANRASSSSSSRGAYMGPSAEPNYGPAYQCTPPTLVSKVVTAAAHKPLSSSRKPNFIIILTDDQGFDDIGLHQPQKPGSRPTWVQTPNLDKFIKGATEFDNFYVAPMCSQSRAALLTGRDFARTGTMLINGGYDYINRAEMTSAEFFAENGYDTAHFGKWHNGRTLGYEPWMFGFQDSWLPSSHVHLDNLMRHNGRYIQTKGLMEQDLMDKIIQYLGKHEADDAKPFYMYYAPHAIHQGFMRPGQGPRWQRPAPEPYKSKYKNMSPKLPSDTAEVWAMLEYMDDVLGRLFAYVAESPLAGNTYIMIMSDNGAELFPTERKGKDKLRRMPSGMMGYKKDVLEGGVRNFLAVKGPGVPGGVTDGTLTSITDVLPTMADLAGLDSAPHPKWDGISMKNLLITGSMPAVSIRGTELADKLQTDRFVFSFSPQCWSPDMVPALRPNRQVLKPQPLLDYDTGGVDGRGFARCIGIRYKDYKWVGDSGKVYKFEGTSHIEQPCNEISGPEKDAVASQLSRLAREYFKSLVSDDHSFEKPTFNLGLDGWSVTNVLPDGAHARTPGRVELLPNGLSGFSRVGDSACFKLDVATAGRYRLQIMYTSQIQASFRLSVGPYSKILDMDAMSVTARIPAARNMRTAEMGYLELPETGNHQNEACLELIASSAPGVPVFDNLSNLRFTLASGKRSWEGWVDKGVQMESSRVGDNQRVNGGKPAAAATSAQRRPAAGNNNTPAPAAARPAAGGNSSNTKRATALQMSNPLYAVDYLAQDSVIDTWEEMQSNELHPHLRATPAMKQAERDAVQHAALRARYSSAKESASLASLNMTAGQRAWQSMRKQYLWVDGQEGVMESLFSPYESEGIYMCAACQPDV